MLLKGAYCVGEHFVDPHGTISLPDAKASDKHNYHFIFSKEPSH